MNPEASIAEMIKLFNTAHYHRTRFLAALKEIAFLSPGSVASEIALKAVEEASRHGQ